MTLIEQDEPAVMVVMPQVLVTVSPLVAVKRRPSTGRVLVFLSVMDRVRLLPSAMSPKARLVGLTTSCGCVPTPESVTESGRAVADVDTANAP